MARLTAALVLILAATQAASAQPSSWRFDWPNTDFSRSAVDFDEILSGGPPKDGIPSIDDPVFVAASEIDIDDVEPVIAVAIEDEARAYPVRILMWHEIVNDVVGGVPVAVTFCPLCNTGIVFERAVDGQVLEFGTTGKLRHSDLVMYDRQTESWWQQFTGEAIVGAMTGARLVPLAARLESLAEFRRRHPDGTVQVPNNPAGRHYGANPYVGYDSRSHPYPFYGGPLPDEIAPLARVVRVDDRAWSLELLRRRGRIEEGDLVLSWTPGQSSALDEALIARSFDVGNVVARRRSPEGLEDIPYTVDFAFAFRAFYPDSAIVTD